MFMQQFSLTVLAAVIFFSFFSYKKAVLFWLPAQFLFNAQVAVRYASPAMSLQIAVNIYLLLFFYIKYVLLGNNRKLTDKFPLWKMCILIFSTYIISSIISPYSTLRGFTTAIKYFVTDIGSIFLAFKFLETDKDIRFFVKSCILVFFIIISLGISEFILNDNLWLDFVYIGSPHDGTTEGRMYYIPPFLGGGHEMRYGMIRAISTFAIHISFGVACVVYFWLFLLMRIQKFNYVSQKTIITTALYILLGIFLCNSKTGMIGLVFVLLSLYSIKKLVNPLYFIIFLFFAVLLVIVFPEYLQNFTSLFDPDVAEEGGGSTVAGRQRQFIIAMRMFSYNPIFGNGIGSIDVLKEISDNSDILGAESVWMQILPERGLFGMLAYCYIFFAYYKCMIKEIPQKILFFFLFSIFVMSTVTGEISQSYWGIVIIAAYRMFRNKKKLENNKVIIT